MTCYPFLLCLQQYARPVSWINALVLVTFLFLSAAPLSAQLVWNSLTYDTTPPIANPYKGFMDYSAGELPGSEEFPHSLEFFYIGMDEFYDSTPMSLATEAADFTALELELEDIASRGRQAVFRIFIDFPAAAPQTGCPVYPDQASREAAAMAWSEFALPDFLIASTAITDYCDGPNDVFGFSPDYTSNALLDEIELLMAAIDARYDSFPGSGSGNDPRIAYLEVGFLGHWGEWHTFLHPSDPLACGVGEFSVHDAMDRVLNVFDATEGAFTKTRVVVSADLLQCQLRFDDPDADTDGVAFFRSIGVHDDDFANSTVCDTSHGYAARSAALGLDDDWRSLPIGGEVQPSIQDTIHADDDALDCEPADTDGFDTGELDAAVSAVHASWLLDFNLFEMPGPSTPPMQIVNAEDTSRAMGYQLYVSQVALPAMQAACEPMDLVLRVENRGVAPLAYDMPVDLVVLDGAVEVASYIVDDDIDLSFVDDAVPVDFAISVEEFGAFSGSLDLALRVPNPMAGGMPLRFANDAQAGDLLMLGAINVTSSGEIFCSGFELGSTAAWSSTTP